MLILHKNEKMIYNANQITLQAKEKKVKNKIFRQINAKIQIW